MTIREGLPFVIKNGYTYHKVLGNNAEMLSNDWIRIYKGKNGRIDNFIFGCDYKDINTIPDEVLDLEYDEQGNWIIGGNLSVDFIIHNK